MIKISFCKALHSCDLLSTFDLCIFGNFNPIQLLTESISIFNNKIICIITNHALNNKYKKALLNILMRCV